MAWPGVISIPNTAPGQSSESPMMDATLGKSFEKAQQMSGASLSTFVASISTSLAVFAAQCFVFLMIRTRFPHIYLPRPLAWDVLAELVQFDWNASIDLDTYFFRRYIRTLLLIFGPFCAVCIPILVPLNYLHGKGSRYGVRGLDTLGWSNVGLDRYQRYWAHLLLASMLAFIVLYIVWMELKAYVDIRQRSHFASLRTVLVEGIPPHWCTVEALRLQLSFLPGEIRSVTFSRDHKRLYQLLERRRALLDSLETGETQRIRRSLQEQGTLVSRILRRSQDTIGLYQRISTLQEEIERAKETSPTLPSAFITFHDPRAARMACQSVIHSEEGSMTPVMLPLSVDDVIWENIHVSWWSRMIRETLSNVLISCLALLCAVPVAFTGLLSQIIYITKAVPWLSWFNTIPPWALGVIQGLIPPIVLAVVLKIFSTALPLLVRKQGISLSSTASLKVQDYYFYFLLTHLTLLITLSAGVTTIANEVSVGGSVAATLAKNLPKASNYFLAYVLLQALSTSASALLRIDRLLVELVSSPLFDRTVSQKLSSRKAPGIEWGCVVPVYTNLACIGMALAFTLSRVLTLAGFLYAVISPVIIAFQMLIFFLFWLVFTQSTLLQGSREQAGSFYPKALKHLIVGIYTMEVALTVLFCLVRDDSGRPVCIGQACVMAVLTCLTAAAHHILNKTLDSLLYFTPLSCSSPGIQPVSSYQDRAIGETPVIRIPSDDAGVHEKEKRRMSRALPQIMVDDRSATLSAAGRIVLAAEI